MTTSTFELATWYDTWNQLGLDNLANKTVPLNYATRYNLAFGGLSGSDVDGYTLEMTGPFTDAVKQQLLAQAPGVGVYASLGPGTYTGIVDAVQDNNQNDNRSTKNIVTWLRDNGYSGISIDAENTAWPPPYMPYVPEFVIQLGPSFKAAGLGIAVSAPWPGEGPGTLYGDKAVQAFNDNVDAVELQDYSSTSTPVDAAVWTDAGVEASILMGGVCTENSDVQTSLSDTQSWTQWAMENGLRGMFSWRLDNDHGTQGQEEDVDPTFTGARMVYDTAASAKGGGR
jgi:Glycosyl hydrolases family 18